MDVSYDDSRTRPVSEKEVVRLTSNYEKEITPT